MNALTTLLYVLLGTVTLAQPPQAAGSVPLSTPPGGRAATKEGSVRRVSRPIPDTYKGRLITVGSGGGVAGKETVYTLLDDGRLFGRKAGEATHVYIGRQTAPNTQKVFWSVEDRCAIKKTDYQHPGNVYRFVSWRKGREVYRVAWAPGDKSVPPNYEQVYKGFMGMLPKH